MNNNEKIRNLSFLRNQKQKSATKKALIDLSFAQVLVTDIIFFDDSITFDVVKKITKIKKEVTQSINSHLQKYSNFDN